MPDNKLVNISIIFIGIVVFALVLRTFDTFLIPFVLAIILTFMLMPLMKFSRKIKIPFGITLGLVSLALIVVVVFVGALLVGESAKIIDNLPAKQDKIGSFIKDYETLISSLNLTGISEFINAEKISQVTGSAIKSLAQMIASFFSKLILVMIFTIFLIPSHKILIGNITKSMNPSKATKFKLILFHVEKSIKDYLFTKSAISLATALTAGVILFFFRVDFVIILTVLFFIFNFIPNIGSIVAVIIALIFHLLQYGFTLNLLWLGLVLFIVQLTFGSIIEPKWSGNVLKLSPIVIILSLFVWYWIWGLVGMMLAVPLTSIIKIVLENISATKGFSKFLA